MLGPQDRGWHVGQPSLQRNWFLCHKERSLQRARACTSQLLSTLCSPTGNCLDSLPYICSLASLPV